MKNVVQPVAGRGPSKPVAAHLIPYQFKPGQSGNPNGRSKKRSLSEALRSLLEKDSVAAAKQLEAMKLEIPFEPVAGRLLIDVIAGTLIVRGIKEASDPEKGLAAFDQAFSRVDPKPRELKINGSVLHTHGTLAQVLSMIPSDLVLEGGEDGHELPAPSEDDVIDAEVTEAESDEAE